MAKRQNLIGQRFGRLTVVAQAEDYIFPNGECRSQWMCKCDCGNEKVVSGKYLIRGTKSCGCLAKEIMSEVKHQPNNWNLNSFDYGVGYTSKGEEFYFDKEEFSKIKEYTWYINNDGYVVTSDRKTHKTILMHRVIINCSDKFEIDHIHGRETRNDNRKSNLRIATHMQNSVNKSLRKNSTSGVTGVIWHKRDKVWQARIKVNYKYIHLGYFDNFDDAVKARMEAEEKYFGKWSYKNSMKVGN